MSTPVRQSSSLVPIIRVQRRATDKKLQLLEEARKLQANIKKSSLSETRKKVLLDKLSDFISEVNQSYKSESHDWFKNTLENLQENLQKEFAGVPQKTPVPISTSLKKDKSPAMKTVEVSKPETAPKPPVIISEDQYVYKADSKKWQLSFDEWIKNPSDILQLIGKLGMRFNGGEKDILHLFALFDRDTKAHKKIAYWLNYICEFRKNLSQGNTYRGQEFADVIGTIANGKGKKAPEAKPQAEKVVFSDFKTIHFKKPITVYPLTPGQRDSLGVLNATYQHYLGRGSEFSVNSNGMLCFNKKEIVSIKKGINLSEYLQIRSFLLERGKWLALLEQGNLIYNLGE